MGHLVLLHNLLWGGALNLLLSCQTTGFNSVSPPLLVWYMGRTGWCTLLQWLHGFHLCLSQPELLIWIQMCIHHPPILGKSQYTWIWLDHTCNFLVSQQFYFCRAWYFQAWEDLEFTDKGPGAHPILPWFLVIDLDSKKRYLKIYLKFLVVGWLFWDLKARLPCTDNGNVKIIIVATW